MSDIALASARLERAALNVQEVMQAGEPVDMERYTGSITRIVIAANTMAHALIQSPDQPMVINDVADLLWRFGELLEIATDGARQ